MRYAEKYKKIFEGGEFLKTGEVKTTRTEFIFDGGGLSRIRHDIKNFIDSNPGCILLDYGCGTARYWHMKVRVDPSGPKQQMTFLEFLGSNLSGFHRYDPYHPVYQKRPPDIKYDIVIVADVLEHVPLDELPEVLKDINSFVSVDGIVIITVPKTLSKNSFIDGENMHCTLMSTKEWSSVIGKYIKKKVQFTHYK
jgi:hypothetical protein